MGKGMGDLWMWKQSDRPCLFQKEDLEGCRMRSVKPAVRRKCRVQTGICMGKPDYSMKIIRQYCDRDYVISEFIMEGTHEGEWPGIKPSNKKLNGYLSLIQN